MDEMIVVRVPDGTKERLERLAAADERTLSQQVRLMIRQALDRAEAEHV